MKHRITNQPTDISPQTINTNSKNPVQLSIGTKAYIASPNMYCDIYGHGDKNSYQIFSDDSYTRIHAGSLFNDILIYNMNSVNEVYLNNSPYSDYSDNHADIVTFNSYNYVETSQGFDSIFFGSTASETEVKLGGYYDEIIFMGDANSTLDLQLNHGISEIVFDNSIDNSLQMDVHFDEIFTDGDIAHISLGVSDSLFNQVTNDSAFGARETDLAKNIQGLHLDLTDLLDNYLGANTEKADNVKMSDNELLLNLQNTPGGADNWVTIADFSGADGAPLSAQDMQIITNYFDSHNDDSGVLV